MWYSGVSPYESQPTNPYDPGVQERPSGAFRLPDQRSADEPVSSGGSHALGADDPAAPHGSVRGPEYPTIRSNGATSLADAPPPVRPTSGGPADPAAVAEPTGVVPPVPERAHAPAESVYRMSRPVSAILIAVVTIGLAIPALVLLVQVTFVDQPTVRGVVPALLLTIGVLLAGGGLCALALGGPAGRDTWLRPPALYLPLGLVLLLAAAVAVV